MYALSVIFTSRVRVGITHPYSTETCGKKGFTQKRRAYLQNLVFDKEKIHGIKRFGYKISVCLY